MCGQGYAGWMVTVQYGVGNQVAEDKPTKALRHKIKFCQSCKCQFYQFAYCNRALTFN